VNLLGRALVRRAPEWFRRWALEQLFRATAGAFWETVPPPGSMQEVKGESNAAARLAQYAQFTRAKAEEAIAHRTGLAEVESRLYANAFALGSRVKRWLGVASVDDAMQTLRMLYGFIDIDIMSDNACGLRVRRCSFSHVYSASVCQVISALDSGLAGGLLGGGGLTFSSRLTEGHECCEATVVAPGEGN